LSGAQLRGENALYSDTNHAPRIRAAAGRGDVVFEEEVAEGQPSSTIASRQAWSRTRPSVSWQSAFSHTPELWHGRRSTWRTARRGGRRQLSDQFFAAAGLWATRRTNRDSAAACDPSSYALSWETRGNQSKLEGRPVEPKCGPHCL